MATRLPSQPAKKASLLANLTTDLITSLRSSADTAVDADRAKWRLDPITYMTDILRLERYSLIWSEAPGFPADHKWDGTPDPMKVICDAIAAGHNVGVESATGTGKTVLLGALAAWFLDCWKNSLVVTVAPKEDQLKLNLWKELRERFYEIIHGRYERARMGGSLRLKMNPPGNKWMALGFTAGVGESEEVATKARGFHEVDMLMIFEETPGIKGPIMNAFRATCVSPHNIRLAVGNPEHAHDQLHLFCQEPNVISVRVSALDHPNVVLNNPMLVPGAVSRQAVEQTLEKYGPNHNIYLSSVRGISPAQSKDALIREEWCVAAVERGDAIAREIGRYDRILGQWVEDLDVTMHDLLVLPPDKLLSRLGLLYPDVGWQLGLGVDVANSDGGDLGAIARGIGPITLEVEDFPCPDANALGMRVAVEIREKGIDPDYVAVDAIGVGAGCVNELMAQGFPIQALNAGAGPVYAIGGTEEFLKLRGEMWWLARLDLEAGRVALPNDRELIADLCTPRWEPKNGKITIEAKESLRKMLKRSPNKGDAWVMWNWARQIRSPGITIGGSSDITW